MENASQDQIHPFARLDPQKHINTTTFTNNMIWPNITSPSIGHEEP